ncbi:MAG: thiamine phosphate synthase, partial [Muribaculaceae bacterium]|nr:thiamine phosphate synthase [Muribaculaceae bacterium]
MWIQVSESLPAGISLKEALTELQPLCEENEVFLIADSDVELAKDMRIHGVHLKKGDMKPAEARELLGPHAVIGVDVNSAADILSLKGQDIDYAVLDFDGEQSIPRITEIIKEVNADGMEIHIVARGMMSLADMTELQKAGVNGFALSRQIIDAADPVTATADILKALGR